MSWSWQMLHVTSKDTSATRVLSALGASLFLLLAFGFFPGWWWIALIAPLVAGAVAGTWRAGLVTASLSLTVYGLLLGWTRPWLAYWLDDMQIAWSVAFGVRTLHATIVGLGFALWPGAPLGAGAGALSALISQQLAQRPAVPSQPPAQPAPQPEQLTADERLKRLQSLRDQGLVTDEEFEEQRKRIIDGI